MSSESSNRIQYRNVVFTLNNYRDDDIEKLKNVVGCTYIVFGKEVSNTGTPHLQGYMEFRSPKNLSTLKKILPTAHFESRKGSAKQASDYCKKGSQSHSEWNEHNVNGRNYGKDADVYEFGELSSQGTRNDLEPVYTAIKNGMDLSEVALTYPNQWIKHHKGFTDFYNKCHGHRKVCPIIYWLYGKPGAGKTSAPVARFNNDYFIKNSGSQWWDGYKQQSCIIFDDFDVLDDKIGFRNLLRIMDNYEYMVEVKGSSIPLNSKYMIFTSDRHPENMFHDPYKWAQVERRIFRIMEVKIDEPVKWAHPLVENKYLDEKSVANRAVVFEECPPELLQQSGRIESEVIEEVPRSVARNEPKCSSISSQTSTSSAMEETSEEEEPVKVKRVKHVKKKFKASSFLDLEAGCSDDSSDE